MKKILLLCILLFALFIPITSKAIVQKSELEFVTDEANILDQESEEYIVRYSDFLYKAKKIDFYVVTVKNLEGEELEDYTDLVFKQFKISKKGLIILVSKEDRKLRIQVGEEMLDTIDSDLIDQYIETYFMPYLEREEWNDGIVNGYSALYKFICEEFGIDATTMEVLDKLDFLTKYKTVIMMLIVWAIAGFSKLYGHFQKKWKYSFQKKIPDQEVFLLVFVILLNIFVVSITYLLKPIFLLFILLLEGYFLYINLSSSNNKNHNKKTITHRKVKKISKQRKKHK